MKRRIHLLPVASALIFAACSDHPQDPLQPQLDSAYSAALATGEGVPDRSEDGTRWMAMRDGELWEYITQHDTAVVVGLRAPGTPRGIWKDRLLITPIQRSAARALVQSVSGVDVLEESSSLPMLELRVSSLQALSALRALPITDYVEPAVMEIGLAGSFGCAYPQWSGSAGTTFAGDLLPPHYTHWDVQVDRAWNRAAGEGVVIGITDTGVSYYQNNLHQAFASDHSEGRWHDHHSTIASGGGTAPAWHDECGHGTRMSGVAVAPMNGSSVAGVAWRSNFMSVRFTNDILMPRTNNTVQAIALAAAFVPHQQPADHRRIVTMAWGSAFAYSPVSDEIRARYAQGALFIGAAGTTGSYGTWTGVVYPAWMDEVVAVSAVKAVGGMYRTHLDAPLWADPYSTFSVSVEPRGGTGPFTYLWSNGSTTPSTTYTAGAAGFNVEYYVQVTDTFDGTTITHPYTTYVEDRSGCDDPDIISC